MQLRGAGGEGDGARGAAVACIACSRFSSVGIRDVFVHGTAGLRNGEHTGATPGKRVNGPGYRSAVGA